jgi:hypothetical protein
MHKRYISPQRIKDLGFRTRDEGFEELFRSKGLDVSNVSMCTIRREFCVADPETMYYPDELKIEYQDLISFAGISGSGYLLALPNRVDSLEPLQPELLEAFSDIIRMRPTFKYFLPIKPRENRGLFPFYAEGTIYRNDPGPDNLHDLPAMRQKEFWNNLVERQKSKHVVYSFPTQYDTTERNLANVKKSARDQNLNLVVGMLEQKPLTDVTSLEQFFFAL